MERISAVTAVCSRIGWLHCALVDREPTHGLTFPNRLRSGGTVASKAEYSYVSGGLGGPLTGDALQEASAMTSPSPM
jgi:hypothetical protein